MKIPSLNKLVKELTKVNDTIDHKLILRTHRIKLDGGKYSSAVKEHSITELPGQLVWYETRRDAAGTYYLLFTVRDNNFTRQIREDALTLQREALKFEAEVSYLIRGHQPAKWENQDYHTAILECPVCGKYVQVNSKPMPNDINIGGSAVALGCEDKEK